MKRNVQKLWSVLLALLMLLSVFSGTVVTAQAKGETITVYLNVQATGWEQAMVYWWGSTETVDWPGVAMIQNEAGLFEAGIPADATGVVFNNGNDTQSCDLHNPVDGDLYLLGAKDWYPATCEHSYSNGSCIYCGQVKVLPEEATIKVFLDIQASGWEQAMVYWWGAEETVEWPGLEMTAEEDCANRFYAIIPSDATGVVFNNGNGTQSPDLFNPVDGALYLVGAGDWYPATCEHEYSGGSCIYCGAENPADAQTRTVYFDLAVIPWDQVYIYWWRDNDNIGAWPGNLMNHEGGSVYSAQVPEDIKGLLFTNGDGDQTSDLELPEEGYIYNKNREDWLPYNGCLHEWDDGQAVAEPTCVTYGTYTFTCTLCEESMDIEFYPLGHDWVDGVCDRCGWMQADLCTVYFDMGFSDRLYVNIYWWAQGEDSPAWPGVGMTYEGGSVYSAQIPSYATNLIFNSEGFKDAVGNTPDLEMPGDGYIYREKHDQWVLHNGCCHNWDGGMAEKHANCEEDGLYVDSCEICGERVEQTIPAFGHSFVEGYCETCGAEDPTEMYTIFYDMQFSDRENVNIYWWTESGSIGDWPGEPMVHQGGSIYFAQVPADVVGVIFNDGSTQTGDLTLPGDNYIYRESIDEWLLHNGCCHEWTDGVCDICGEGESEETDTTCNVYFDNTFLQYETVYVEWYVDEESKVYSAEMTHVGGNTYTAEVPYDVTVWFSNGQGATDLGYSYEGYLFVKDGVQLTFDGCCHEWDSGDLGSNFNCMQGGVCTYTCQSCDEFFEEEIASRNHKVVDGVCTECGATMGETIEVRLNIDGFDGEKVYVYWWGSEYGVAIPGMEMQQVCTTMYSAQIPADANKLCFSIDNRVESQILVLPESGMTYVMKEGIWDVDTIHYIVDGVCLRCGYISTGLVEQEDGTYYYESGVRSDATGLIKYDGAWYYIVNGKLADQTTSFVKYNGEWWYVVGGKVASDMTTLVKYNGEWWYVVKGKIAANTTSLVKYNGEWWYVVKGKIASKTTTLVKYNGEWWYVVKGKIASKTTTLVKYNGEWWYVVKGKIAGNTTTLVNYNGGWYYLVKGKLAAKTTTLVKYNGVWYYVENGKVNFSYTGSFVFGGGTYRIVKGKVA